MSDNLTPYLGLIRADKGDRFNNWHNALNPNFTALDTEAEKRKSWNPYVLNIAALPPIGNNIGDSRFVLSEGGDYYWNGASWQPKAGGGSGGATKFTDLTDTPNVYTGQASKIVKVKGDETGLEFGTASGAVDSVNGKTGIVVLNAADVSAAGTDHNTTHEDAGSDEIDGEKLKVTQAVSNYTPSTATLAGHLNGIDIALGSISPGSTLPENILFIDPSKPVTIGYSYQTHQQVINYALLDPSKRYLVLVTPGTYSEDLDLTGLLADQLYFKAINYSPFGNYQVILQAATNPQLFYNGSITVNGYMLQKGSATYFIDAVPGTFISINLINSTCFSFSGTTFFGTTFTHGCFLYCYNSIIPAGIIYTTNSTLSLRLINSFPTGYPFFDNQSPGTFPVDIILEEVPIHSASRYLYVGADFIKQSSNKASLTVRCINLPINPSGSVQIFTKVGSGSFTLNLYNTALNGATIGAGIIQARLNELVTKQDITPSNNLEITGTPTNYTPSAATIGGHLSGIDTALNNMAVSLLFTFSLDEEGGASDSTLLVHGFNIHAPNVTIWKQLSAYFYSSKWVIDNNALKVSETDTNTLTVTNKQAVPTNFRVRVGG